jgi:arsenite-transporting ATPase
VGLERLEELAKVLYSDGEDPSAVTRLDRPFSFEKIDGHYEIHLKMPFALKGEIGLFKKADELVVEVGTLRRHIGLPTSMAALVPGRARLDESTLVIEMKES